MIARFPHIVIRASAGTGKTYQLANRFIALLHSGVSAQQILATTFTRKAAGEIFSRVLLRLAEAVHSDASRKQLSEAIAAEEPLSREECLRLLVQTVRQLHLLRVSTLDSFFARIAMTFGLEMGLPPGWNICDEATDAQLRDEAIENVLAREKTSDLLALMNLLTKGEAKRSISELVLNTVGQLYNLYRETEPEAWRQLQRISGLSSEELGSAIDQLQAIEFGSQAKKACEKDVAAVLAGDFDRFIANGLAAKVLCGENSYYRKPLPADAIGVYTKLLQHAASHLVGQIALQTQGTFELLQKFSAEYERLKHERGALRFEDVTQRLTKAIEHASERLEYRLDSGIDHVLLDEFQDTSLPQWQVLRPLAKRITTGTGSFFCVGDGKQAIYGWRGGLASLFDSLDTDLTGIGREQLTVSYRSSPAVIEAVNQTFTQLSRHDELGREAAAVLAWQQQYPLHTTAKTNLPGYVCLQAGPAANDDENAKDVIFRMTAEQVAAAAERSPGMSIGVLVRSNDAVGRIIYLLREKGIAASEEGGNPLFDAAPIELLLSVLRIADHPGDTAARFHVATSPLAQALQFTVDNNSDVAAAALSRRIRQQLLSDGYGPTIYAWAKLLEPHCSRRDLNRMQQMVELAYQHQPSSTLRADQFIAVVERAKVADPTQDNVRVMTIHQSKGLQFDIVFLPELEPRLIGQNDWFVAGRPSATAPVNVVCRYANSSVRQLLPPRFQKLFEDAVADDVTESLCVLYVAMTRAIHALHMIVRPQDKPKLPATFSGLLRAALVGAKPLLPLEIGYECGDRNWHLAAASTQQGIISEATTTTEMVPQPRIAFAQAAKRSRSLERASPSSFEGGERVPLADVFRPSSSKSRHYGTLAHAWMQMVGWLDDGDPSDDALLKAAQRLAGEIGDVTPSFSSLAAQWRAALAQPAVSAALRRNFYRQPPGFADPAVARACNSGSIDLDVQTERPFAVRDGEQLLVGSIDRLVLVRSGGKLIAADIVDFKTDQLPAGDHRALLDRTNFYGPQLNAYRRAVAKLYALPTTAIGARLIFFACDAVQTVD